MAWLRFQEVCLCSFLLCGALSLCAQGPDSTKARQPVRNQTSSEITYSTVDGADTVEIENAAYEVTETSVPGRPQDERLVLRKRIHSKYVLDEVGMEATATVEAWPLGTGLEQKPLYTLTVAGLEAKTVDGALMVVDRGLEEVEWWSVYKLGSGQHLFDTYVPLVRFSISRSVQTLRYAGFETPPDDTADSRLKEPHVVGVLTYASGSQVIREAQVTSDDARQAALLRSYADETRAVYIDEVPAPGDKRSEPSRSIRISFTQNYPSSPTTTTIVIPLAGDDLDITHALLPAHLRVSAWKR